MVPVKLIPDTIDLSAYGEQDPRVKVREASSYLVDVRSQFTRKTESHSSMFSTKLRKVLQFRPGEVTVWAGYNGHRKSMFTGQVGLDLGVQRERVLLASFEMYPAKTIARMVQQAWGTAEPTERQVDTFANWSDGRLWMFDHMGRIAPEQCCAVLRYFADELDGSQAFVDSMMMVCASEESLDEQKQFMTDLVRLAQETGLHVHLVAHCRKPQDETKPPTKYDLRGSAAISDQAHNVVMVWANKAKKAKLEQTPHDEEALAQPDALVIVDKQRNGHFEGRVKLWVDEASMRFCDDRTSPIEPYAMEVA